jgi:hypothetical protein
METYSIQHILRINPQYVIVPDQQALFRPLCLLCIFWSSLCALNCANYLFREPHICFWCGKDWLTFFRESVEGCVCGRIPLSKQILTAELGVSQDFWSSLRLPNLLTAYNLWIWKAFLTSQCWNIRNVFHIGCFTVYECYRQKLLM